MPTQLPDGYKGEQPRTPDRGSEPTPEHIREMIKEDAEDEIRGREAAGFAFITVFVLVIIGVGIFIYLYLRNL